MDRYLRVGLDFGANEEWAICVDQRCARSGTGCWWVLDSRM